MYKIFAEVFDRTEYPCTEKKKTSLFIDDVNKKKEELLKTLNQSQIEQLNSLMWYLENHYDEVDEDYCNYAICFGFKLGMEFREFLNTPEE